MADISQTFLLIATFDIALISIAIANYAVSASYLGRETRLTRFRLQKRKDLLDKSIKELQAKGDLKINDLKNEIKKAEKVKEGLRQRILLLSWGGAVIIPCVFFLISLIIAILGMNLDSGYLPNLMVSPLFLAFGFVFFLVVIGTIDSAARQMPLPKFEVYFENKAEILILKSNEQKIIDFCVANEGEDIAENVMVFIHFPPVFRLHHHHGYYEIAQQGPSSNYPNFNAVYTENLTHHPDTTCHIPVNLNAPEKEGKYEIPIIIYERKTGKTKCKLTIEVTA
jgi:hypothetical protein